MNVLVTGAAGYIGCRLTQALIAAGHRITAVDKLIFGDESLAGLLDKLRLHAIDIRATPPSDFAGIEAVIHMAGLSNDPTAEFRPEANRSINLDATIRLAQLAKNAGVQRFIFASSCSVYQRDQQHDDYQDETTAVAPSAPYSWSKWQAETALLGMADGNFQPTILRMGTVFGESPRMRYDLVVNAMTRDAFTKRQVVVHAGGQMWRPLLHVDDAVAGICKALIADQRTMGGQIYNLLGGNYRIEDVANQVRQEVQLAFGLEIGLEVQQGGMFRSYRVRGDRFREAAGFVPAHDIASAVRVMWTTLSSGVDPGTPIFYNIKWFEMLIEMERRLQRMGGSVY